MFIFRKNAEVETLTRRVLDITRDRGNAGRITPGVNFRLIGDRLILTAHGTVLMELVGGECRYFSPLKKWRRRVMKAQPELIKSWFVDIPQTVERAEPGREARLELMELRARRMQEMHLAEATRGRIGSEARAETRHGHVSPGAKMSAAEVSRVCVDPGAKAKAVEWKMPWRLAGNASAEV